MKADFVYNNDIGKYILEIRAENPIEWLALFHHFKDWITPEKIIVYWQIPDLLKSN